MVFLGLSVGHTWSPCWSFGSNFVVNVTRIVGLCAFAHHGRRSCSVGCGVVGLGFRIVSRKAGNKRRIAHSSDGPFLGGQHQTFNGRRRTSGAVLVCLVLFGIWLLWGGLQFTSEATMVGNFNGKDRERSQSGARDAVEGGLHGRCGPANAHIKVRVGYRGVRVGEAKNPGPYEVGGASSSGQTGWQQVAHGVWKQLEGAARKAGGTGAGCAFDQADGEDPFQVLEAELAETGGSGPSGGTAASGEQEGGGGETRKVGGSEAAARRRRRSAWVPSE